MIGLITGSEGSDTVLMSHGVQGSAFVVVVVQTVAGICIAMYATNAWGRGARSTRRSLVQVAALVVLAVLGATWVVQAAAGISIFAFSSTVFGRLARVRRRLLVSALAILVFAALGAGWVLIPFAALIAVRAMNLLGSGPSTQRNCANRHRRDEATRVDLSKSPGHVGAPGPVHAAAQPDITAYLNNTALPPAAGALIREITERSRAAASYLAQQGRSSGVDAIEVERIRDDYAPEAVRGYLALPPWSADDTVLADGKTGAQLLVDQLQLLARRLHGIQESVALTGGEQLRSHGAFLRDRFPSEPGGPLSL